MESINYNEDIMKTQFYDKVDTYDTLDYTEESVKATNNPGDTTKIKHTFTYHICVDMKPKMDSSANL